MNIQEIKDTLTRVSFADSNLNMGWEWDIRVSKIYDDNGTTLEKGYVIRTTFMRPDILTGEVDKGYGRWMYIPENITTDGLVKTAWVCAELIVKHELMEAFLYDNKKIFDPHKSLKDLQHNATDVKKVVVDPDKVIKSEPILVKEGSTKSSEEVFHKQNVGNHIQEIKGFLDVTYKKVNIRNENVKRYAAKMFIIDLHLAKNGLTFSDSNGAILESLTGSEYTLSKLKEILDKYELLGLENFDDPGLINEIIIESGYTEVNKHITENGNDLNIWKYINPKNSSRYILHSETNKFVSMVNKNHDIIGFVEDGEYNYDNVKKLLGGSK